MTNTFCIKYIINNRNGPYKHFGRRLPIEANDEAWENFFNWIKTSTFKKNCNHILFNMNFLSYAYICKDNIYSDFYKKDSSDCVSKEYLEKKRPDILEEVNSCGYCILGYMLTYPGSSSYMKLDNVDCVDLIDTRLRDHDIARELMYKYMQFHSYNVYDGEEIVDHKQCDLIPMEIAPESASPYWNYVLCITNSEDFNKFMNKYFKSDFIAYDEIEKNLKCLKYYIENYNIFIKCIINRYKESHDTDNEDDEICIEDWDTDFKNIKDKFNKYYYDENEIFIDFYEEIEDEKDNEDEEIEDERKDNESEMEEKDNEDDKYEEIEDKKYKFREQFVDEHPDFFELIDDYIDLLHN